MEQIFKRTMCLILTLVIVVGMLPVSAISAEAEESVEIEEESSEATTEETDIFTEETTSAASEETTEQVGEETSEPTEVTTAPLEETDITSEVAGEESGLVDDASVVSVGIPINEENFPDPVFRNYVSTYMDFSTQIGDEVVPGDGFLDELEILFAGMISIEGWGVRNLKGIELFPYLSSLNCDSNYLTTLDLSQNTELAFLSAQDNELTSINVSNNLQLMQLDVSGNLLTTLDVSNNTALTSLRFGGKQFGEVRMTEGVDLSKLPLLEDLSDETGIDLYHSDFWAAAQEVKKNIKVYLGQFEKNGTPIPQEQTRAHICGHSRAAAVANIICRDINEEGYLSFRDMTSYNFATPNSMREKLANSGMSGNVHNIVDAADIVAFVPQNYCKYGRTYVQGLFDLKEYPEDVQALLNKYARRTVTRPNNSLLKSVVYWFGESGNQFLSNAETAEKIGSCLSNRPLIESDIAKAHGAENYLAWVNAGIKTDNDYNTAMIHLKMISEKELSVLKPILQKLFPDVEPNNAINALMLERLRSDAKINVLGVSCPVNVELLDSAGNVVASFVDHQLISDSEDVMAWSEGESDFIVYPSGQDYTLRILGTGEGTMHIGTLQTNSEFEDLGSVQYGGIPVSPGQLWEFDLQADSSPEDWKLFHTVTFRIPGQVDQMVSLLEGERIPSDRIPRDEYGQAETWYRNEACTGEPVDVENMVVQENIVLYCQRELRTVTFQLNNGQEPVTAEVYSGVLLTPPGDLVLPAHTLYGWYTDPALTTAWDFSTPVTQDMTLHAKWQENIIDKAGSDTGISVEIVNPQGITYTGKPIKPEIIVRDGGKILVAGTDYTVTYKNNTNACDHTDSSIKASKLPQILVQGKGNYKNAKKITVPFTIYPANLADLEVKVPTVVGVKDKDKLQTITAEVRTEAAKVSAKAYTLRYFTDEELANEVSGLTAAGTYYVVVEAVEGGNLRGATGAIPVVVVPKSQMLSSAKLTAQKNIQATADILEEEAAIQAVLSKLVVNKVTYLTDEDNISEFVEIFAVTAKDSNGKPVELGKVLNSAGKKTITITAREGNAAELVGEKSLSITVKGIPLSKKQFTLENLKLEYNGEAQQPTITTELVPGTDYTVSFLRGKTGVKEPIDAGSYSLVITGQGLYSGKLTYKFTIASLDLNKAFEAGLLSIAHAGTATYSPSKAEVPVSLAYNGQTLAEGEDYTLKFSGNTKVTDKAQITITGKGNFKGTLKGLPELTYAITPKAISSKDVVVNVTGMTIKKGVVTAVKFTLKDSGKTVSAKEYTSEIQELADQVQLTITGADLNYTGTRTLLLDKILTKTTSKQVKIARADTDKLYYTGSPIRPAITITDPDGNDISDCFTVTYGENTNVGIGTITVTGNPEMGYYGAKTLKFTILPKWLKWLFG